MSQKQEDGRERKYYTAGHGKPPIFVQAIIDNRKMSAVDFFHITDAYLDWDKAGDDAAVLEPLIAFLAEWGDELIFAFADRMAKLLYSLDTRKIAQDIYKDSFFRETIFYMSAAQLWSTPNAFIMTS